MFYVTDFQEPKNAKKVRNAEGFNDGVHITKILIILMLIGRNYIVFQSYRWNEKTCIHNALRCVIFVFSVEQFRISCLVFLHTDVLIHLPGWALVEGPGHLHLVVIDSSVISNWSPVKVTGVLPHT